MANPFLSSIREVLGGAPTAGNHPLATSKYGAFPAAPTAQSMAAAPTYTPPAPASSNPFSRFTSSRLGASNGPLARAGWIGALLTGGNPTLEQQQQAAMAGPLAQAGQTIQADIAAGKNPGRAILDFIQTPAGQEYFTSGGDMKQLAGLADLATPVVPKAITLSPGEVSGTLSPTTGEFTPGYIAPTTKEQEFNAMSEIAGLSPDSKKLLVTQTLAGAGQPKLTEKKAAIDRLVSEGKMSQDTADMILGGVLHVSPIMDAAGNTTGYGVINTATNTVQSVGLANAPAPDQIPQPGQVGFEPGVTPGTRPEDAEGQDNQPIFQGMDNPADIVDSAGFIGKGLQSIGSVFGVWDPNMAFTDVTRNQGALGAIKSDANQIAKNGKVLASEMKDIARLTDGLTDWMTSPADATQTLINLWDRYDNMDRQLNDIVNDPKRTGKVRGEAAIDLANIQKAKANLPSRESLTEKLASIKAEAPGENVKKTLQGAEDAAKKSFNESTTTSSNGKVFASQNDFIKAWKAGNISDGDSVTIDGKKFDVRKKR